ncbi:MAG: hypothetical protein VX290_18240, partial [Candidatus Latescibacterota bacterium]|nr:hypothetical protein [Candidatus Latescibacterota bacterium]
MGRARVDPGTAWDPTLVPQTGDRFERRSSLQPHLGIHLPTCCFVFDASYDYYGGVADSSDVDLDLHDVGVGLSLTADPSKVTFQATLGVDLLFLRQKGTIAGSSSRTSTDNEWGWRLAIRATYEPVPRWGIDLRWLRRGRVQPRVAGARHDLSGWQVSAGSGPFHPLRSPAFA